MADTYRRMTLEAELLEAAINRAEDLPVLSNSYRREQANLVGCIGEVVFEQFLSHHQIEFKDVTRSTRRDYVIGKSLSLDVKTKDRTVRPSMTYENSVPLYNHEHQRPDYYYFVSLLRDRSASLDDPRRFKEAFLVGGISLPDLEREAVHRKTDEIDPANNTKFWTDCLNVRMDQLESNAAMLEMFRAA